MEWYPSHIATEYVSLQIQNFSKTAFASLQLKRLMCLLVKLLRYSIGHALCYMYFLLMYATVIADGFCLLFFFFFLFSLFLTFLSLVLLFKFIKTQAAGINGVDLSGSLYHTVMGFFQPIVYIALLWLLNFSSFFLLCLCVRVRILNL